MPSSAKTLCLLLFVSAIGACNGPFDLIDIQRSRHEYEPPVDVQGERPRRQLVVLQHGMLRSSWAFWRLEKALERQGYEVLNTSYPSLTGAIEEHAALLDERIEDYLLAHPGPDPELAMVGHSMGGLVIRSYLSRPDARQAKTCVFLGTPHRGAHLATHYGSTWFFRNLGGEAAQQLLPGHEFYDTLSVLTSEHIGCIYGVRGDGAGWSKKIPGEDDDRVSVAEAQLPEQTDSIALNVEHTWLPLADESLDQVMRFLRYGKFGT